MQEELINVVDPFEARRWLGVSAPTYNALLESGLLGRVTPENQVVWEDLQHYGRYGTQWQVAGRPPLPTRMVSAEFIQNMPPPRTSETKSTLACKRGSTYRMKVCRVSRKL
jgi:hypothetical protein